MRSLSRTIVFKKVSLINKELIMLFNNVDIHAIDINLDGFTTLHIAERRVDGMIVVMAECCRQFCDVRKFANVADVYAHYSINNSDLRDTISRIIDAIDGKL